MAGILVYSSIAVSREKKNKKSKKRENYILTISILRMMKHRNNDRCEANRKINKEKKTNWIKHHTCLNAKRMAWKETENSIVESHAFVRENKRIWKFLYIISLYERRETYEHTTFLPMKLLLCKRNVFSFFCYTVVVAQSNCQAECCIWFWKGRNKLFYYELNRANCGCVSMCRLLST